MGVMRAGALVFAVMACGVILFHLAMILGAPWGHLTMGGQWSGPLPGAVRMLSALSAVLIAVMAVVLLIRAGILSGSVPNWAVFGCAGFMALGVVMNFVSPSAPERLLWVPVTAIMLIAALVVAFAGRR
jgi:hypothetical protein